MNDSKILIVVDTTTGWNEIEAQNHGIGLVALSVILDGKEYKDQLEMSVDEVYEAQKAGKLPTTSQPSIGYLEECLSKWKHYENIIVLPMAAGLSGTYQAFCLAKDSLNMDHVHIVDTKTLASPLKDCALSAKKMVDENYSVSEILDMIQEKLSDTLTYVIPKNLEQLKRGGRISTSAAALGGLLKIKPLLKLKEDGSVVDKLGMARTETKLFQMICDDLKNHHVTPQTHKLCFAHAHNEETFERLKAVIVKQVGEFEILKTTLPTTLGVHTGDGCLALQTIKKSKWD